MTLSSNVVNYLVWQYLRESGLSTVADQLSRCWHRDPDLLPFAQSVPRHCLVWLIQDGIEWDKLKARASNADTTYNFGADHGRPYPEPNGPLLTLDKGIPAHQLAAEAANGVVHEPAPKKGVKRKKQPKTNGVPSEPRPDRHTQEPEVNGDAMDLDHNGPAQPTNTVNNIHTLHTVDSVHSLHSVQSVQSVNSVNSVNSVRADSEPAPSEADSPSVIDIPISTLRIGADALIQTDHIIDLTQDTIFIPPPQDSKKLIEHTAWEPKECPLLLAAGRSILEIYNVDDPSSQDEHARVRTIELPLPVTNFDITALCWQSDNEITVSAREQCVNEVGEKMTMDKLIKIAGDTSHAISSTAGLVTTLRWNPTRELLLSISTDGEKGSIKIWKTDSDSIPAWTDFTATQIYDAYWISDSAFVVCGTELFKIYDVDDNSLTIQQTLDTQVTWENIKYDAPSRIIAALGIRDKRYYLGILHPNDSINLQVHEYPDAYPADLDFRFQSAITMPTNGSSLPHTLLATCSLSGHARIWDANDPFTCVRRLSTTDNCQAFKIAFSPNGTLLAAAGPDAVTIWDVEKREVPVACWRANDCPSDKWNSSADGEFNLGWDHDSSRISIALGNQIAIIPVNLDSR